MKDRILEMLKARGMSQSELENRVGVSRQNVNAWIKGRSEPGDRELIARIADALGCSVTFLLFGERTEQDETEGTGTDYVSIPVFDVKASCGTGCENFDLQLVKMIRVAVPWLRTHVRSRSFDHLNVITASGDSMIPTINDGDLVLIDTSEKVIHSDRIFCVVVDGELFLKRVQRIPGGVRLISDNDRYPPVNVTGDAAEQMIVCGSVRCVLEAKAM